MLSLDNLKGISLTVKIGFTFYITYRPTRLKTVVYVRLCLVLIILDQGSVHVNNALFSFCLHRVQMKSELERIRQINSKISMILTD